MNFIRIITNVKTRMHSSRIHTGHSLAICQVRWRQLSAFVPRGCLLLILGCLLLPPEVSAFSPGGEGYIPALNETNLTDTSKNIT